MHAIMRSMGTPNIIICSLLCITTAMIVAWATTVIKDRKTSETLMLAHNQTREVLAIKELHSKLDDNKDGQVDFKESTEFVREKLHPDSQSGDRSQTLHLEDDRISLEDLWKKWTESKAYNWTNDEVIKWLVGVVDLPELVPQFRKLHVNGKQLPLIATNSDQILTQLEVKGHQKHKLQLRAMDTVLFGPLPTPHSHWKDAVMILSVLLCLLGLAYAWKKHHSANKKIDKFLGEMRVYEKELKFLRKNFNQSKAESIDGGSANVETENKQSDESSDSESGSAEKVKPVSSETSGNVPRPQSSGTSCDVPRPQSQSSETSCDLPRRQSSQSSNKEAVSDTPQSDSSVPRPQSVSSDMEIDLTQKLESMRMRIWNLERQLEAMNNNRLALKELLVESCQQEWFYLDANKRTAEDEVVNAQKLCDKIKKKRTTVIGAFRLANSSTLEDAGLLITRAVNKMQRVTTHFDDYHRRWKNIEQLCGFQILGSSQSEISTLSTDSARSPRNGGAYRRFRNSSASLASPRSRNNSYRDDRESALALHSFSSSNPRSYSVNDSEMRPNSLAPPTASELPSWYSAPNNLYRKSSFSELAEFDEGMISPEFEEGQKYWDSFDSLGMIEEERVECFQLVQKDDTDSPAVTRVNSQTEISNLARHSQIQTRLKAKTRSKM